MEAAPVLRGGVGGGLRERFEEAKARVPTARDPVQNPHIGAFLGASPGEIFRRETGRIPVGTPAEKQPETPTTRSAPSEASAMTKLR